MARGVALAGGGVRSRRPMAASGSASAPP